MELAVKVLIWLLVVFLVLGVVSYVWMKLIYLRERLQLKFVVGVMFTTVFGTPLCLSFLKIMNTVTPLIGSAELNSINTMWLVPILVAPSFTLINIATTNIMKQKREQNRH